MIHSQRLRNSLRRDPLVGRSSFDFQFCRAVQPAAAGGLPNRNQLQRDPLVGQLAKVIAIS